MRRWLRGCLLFLLAMAWVRDIHGQQTAATAEQTSIRKVLASQVAAWNRGDLTAFMQGYQNAPDTTFVGKTVEHGYAAVLARYRRNFPTQAEMGTLAFTDLEIRPLGADCAVATGQFHLARDAAHGGAARGIFSLVLVKTAGGWKITLDHTS